MSPQDAFMHHSSYQTFSMHIRTVVVIALAFMISNQGFAQEAQKIGQVYQVPFATTGNRIDLSVANVGQEDMTAVRVVSAHKPVWLRLDVEELVVNQVGAEADEIASFGFSVERDAPIGEEGRVRFEIVSGEEVIGVKEFVLAVEAPAEAALDQNYPNPFSQSTTIGYDIPEAGAVHIGVYDMLGRQVSVVVDEEQAAGHHQVTWDASGLASGMYFYILRVRGEEAGKMLRNKMIVVN